MTVALFTHAACLEHVTPAGHPERAARLPALLTALEGPEFQFLFRKEAQEATKGQLQRAHPEEYVSAVWKAAPRDGLVRIDADTSMSPGSLRAALHAAGAVVSAVDLVLSGHCKRAFCAVRPPGHHAEKTRAMGFCLFNNIAVGAFHALETHGLERVAVVDFDVHHGNGTQDIFWNEGRVLFASTHQMPLYPGTGSKSESGVGNIVNVPLSPNDGSGAFRAAIREVIRPRLEAFRPELILVSAGFDAHARDPLAQLRLQDVDFEWVTQQIVRIAQSCADGRVVSTLEGGYDLEALASAGAAHVRALRYPGADA